MGFPSWVKSSLTAARHCHTGTTMCHAHGLALEVCFTHITVTFGMSKEVENCVNGTVAIVILFLSPHQALTM